VRGCCFHKQPIDNLYSGEGCSEDEYEDQGDDVVSGDSVGGAGRSEVVLRDVGFDESDTFELFDDGVGQGGKGGFAPVGGDVEVVRADNEGSKYEGGGSCSWGDEMVVDRSGMLCLSSVNM
jgi:hypothetical protein